MLKIHVTSIVFVYMLFHIPAMAENLVLGNQGFEVPELSGSALEYYNGVGPTGWTLSGTGTVPGVGAYVAVIKAGESWWTNREAAVGTQFLCLSAYYDSGYIERSFPTVSQSISTIAGASYRIRFAACTNPGAPGLSTVQVQFGNLNQTTGSIPSYDTDEWTYYEYTTTASSSSTVLSFTRGDSETCIDDVSVTRIVGNSGFETPTTTNAVEYYNGVSPTGWTLSGTGTVPGVGPYVAIIRAGGLWWSSRTAAEESQFIWLSAYYGAGYVERSFPTISQDIATASGQRYKVRFAACTNPGAPGPSTLQVRFGSLDVTTSSIPSYDSEGWTYYEFAADATSSTTTLSFSRGSSEPCVDDVCVFPVSDNLGFETPGVTNGVGIEYYNGSSPSGWELSGTGTVQNVGPYVAILQAGGSWWSSGNTPEGDQFMWLSAYYGSGYVERSFPTLSHVVDTVPGEKYKIRFAAVTNPSADGLSTIRVKYGDLDVTTDPIPDYSDPANYYTGDKWVYYEYMATTQSVCTTLSFTRDGSEAMLDDISVTKMTRVPLSGLSIWCQSNPTDAETEAVDHLNDYIEDLTGSRLTVNWGGAIPSRAIIVGNRATLGGWLDGIITPTPSDQDFADDLEKQSYALLVRPSLVSGNVLTAGRIVAAGLGQDRNARGLLGMSYAIGALLRSLSVDGNGAWGFDMEDVDTVKSPLLPVRDLYIQNSWGAYPGISIEQFTDQQIEDYVDFIVDAGYSRVSFWMWRETYLYSDTFINWSQAQKDNAAATYGLYTNDLQAYAENSHERMKYYMDYARSRGLETYQMLTPAHVMIDSLTPPASQWAGVGFYGSGGGCWNLPAVKALSNTCMQQEMEYFAPVDGYVLWFYDPAGCFCTYCRANQADQLFDQAKLIIDKGNILSPGCKYTIGLSPAYTFPEYGIMTQQELDTIMPDFLDQVYDYIDDGKIMVCDHGENDQSGLWNGWTDPSKFNRQQMLYSTYGMTGEQGYMFPHVKAGYIHRNLAARAKGHGAEGGMVMIQHSAVNKPGVYAAGYDMYERSTSWEDSIRAYSDYIAKGGSRQPLESILLNDELVQKVGYDPSEYNQIASNYIKQDGYITSMESALDSLLTASYYLGDLDQMEGFVMARRYYWQLAECTDESEFANIANAFESELATISMYNYYVTYVLYPSTLGYHAKWDWRWWVWDRNNDTGL